MKLILPAALLAIALIATPVQAQTAADQAGQQACGNDAFSLCGDAIPDRGRIEACLRRNFSRVSASCRTYMASYGRTHRVTRAQHRQYRDHRVVRRHHYVRRHHRTVRCHYDRHHYYRC